jgi:ribonuclease P protein component
VLPAKNRLRTSKDFALTTKTGFRATSLSLVVYLRPVPELSEPQIGFIVNKSIGGSVTRHRVSRQLRHLVAQIIPTLATNSKNTQIVVRVLRKREDYKTEIVELIEKATKKLVVNQ